MNQSPPYLMTTPEILKSTNARYKLLRHIVRGVLGLYYRNIESYGTNFLPKRGRTLIIANHQAGLIDGLLILSQNRQVIRELIKHTLWENPLIGFFATGLGMIPVSRKQDLKPEDLNDPKTLSPGERHRQSFQRVEDALLANENVLVFPEGISHDRSYTLKLRSGAARMILQTEAKFDFRVGIQWLPVTIDLEVKDHPGGRVVMHYHPPRKLDKYRDLYVHDTEAAVNALRSEMEFYLKDITLNFSSWEDRLFIERLMEIWIARTPTELLLDRHNLLLKWKRILENSFVLMEERGDWELLRKKVDHIHQTARIAQISIREIFEERSPDSYKKLLWQIIPTLFFWIPVMIFGYIFWWIPVKLVRIVTAKATKGHRDIVATYHVVGAFIVFPIWIALFVLVGPFFIPAQFLLPALIGFGFAGYAILNRARKVRIGFRELFNLYRFGSLSKMIYQLRGETQQVWSLGARLWNRALARQVAIEDE